MRPIFCHPKIYRETVKLAVLWRSSDHRLVHVTKYHCQRDKGGCLEYILEIIQSQECNVVVLSLQS